MPIAVMVRFVFKGFVAALAMTPVQVVKTLALPKILVRL